MFHAFAVPIRAGKSEAFRHLAGEVRGPRLADFSELQRRSGVLEEYNWIQATPAGDLAIALIKVLDDDGMRDRMVCALAGMPEPFSSWFRQQIEDIFGFDPGSPSGAAPSELILHWVDDSR